MSNNNQTSFIKIIRWIYDHIDEPIKLEDIAKQANLSVSSLKRIFIEATNRSPGQFIRHLRMELAFRSLQSRNDSILEIALNAGFEDQSAFTRSFKEIFGYTPNKAREKLNILNELEHVALEDPEIVELVDLSLQSITKTGLYFEAAPKAWSELKTKLNDFELSDDFAGLFIGVGHDNPHEGGVKEDQVRFTAGATLVERNLGIETTCLSGGQYAKFRYLGKIANLGLAYHYIYGKWSTESSRAIDKKRPAFIVFDRFPEAAIEQNILIYLPLMSIY